MMLRVRNDQIMIIVDFLLNLLELNLVNVLTVLLNLHKLFLFKFPMLLLVPNR